VLKGRTRQYEGRTLFKTSADGKSSREVGFTEESGAVKWEKYPSSASATEDICHPSFARKHTPLLNNQRRGGRKSGFYGELGQHMVSIKNACKTFTEKFKVKKYQIILKEVKRLYNGG